MRVTRLPSTLLVGTTVVLLTLLVGACGSTPATPSPSAPSPQPSIAAPSLPPTAPPPSPSAGASSAGPDADASPAVRFDASLLAILPATIDGASVTADPESMSEAESDPGFVANVQSAAFAIVISDGNPVAWGIVARLRPGAYSNALYRDWRETYNQGACDQAGGVVGNAEAELGGRTVHITSCAGGLLVYHAYLPERDVVISMVSLGERRFGEELMRGLRP